MSLTNVTTAPVNTQGNLRVHMSKSGELPPTWISLIKKKIDGESLPVRPFLLSQIDLSPKDSPFVLALGMLFP